MSTADLAEKVTARVDARQRAETMVELLIDEGAGVRDELGKDAAKAFFDVVRQFLLRETKAVFVCETCHQTFKQDTCSKCSEKERKAKRGVSAHDPFGDDDAWPWGKFEGERGCDVPDDYLDWFLGQDWCDNWPELVSYANERLG